MKKLRCGSRALSLLKIITYEERQFSIRNIYMEKAALPME